MLKIKSFHPVLNYLVQHVRPPSERSHIRWNLKHYQMRKDLLEEKEVSQVRKRYLSLISSIETVEKDLASEAFELKKVVEEEEKFVREERELRCKLALLQVVIEEKKRKISELELLTEAVNQLMPKRVSTESVMDDSIKLSSAINELKVILQKIKVLKQRLLNSKDEGFHDIKVEIFDMIESMVGQYSARTVLKALLFIVVKEMDNIDQATQRIDLAADAKALSMKYKPSGEFVDLLPSFGIMESIEAMLVEMSAKHLKNHFRNNKYKREIQVTEQSIENALENIETLAQELYGKKDIVSEILRLCRETLKIAGLRASQSAAANLSRGLDERETIAKKAKEALLEKYSEIQCFDEKVKANVFDLKSIAVASNQSLKHLEDEQSRITSEVVKFTSQVKFSSPVLRGSLSKEVDAFLEVPFEVFKTYQPGDDSAILHTVGPLDVSHPGLKDLSSLMPYHATWEGLVECVREMKSQRRLLEYQLDNGYSVMEKIMKFSKELSLYHIRDICKAADRHDKQLKEKLVPLLERCENANENIHERLERLRDVVEEWWTQPGKEIDDYVKSRKKL